MTDTRRSPGIVGRRRPVWCASGCPGFFRIRCLLAIGLILGSVHAGEPLRDVAMEASVGALLRPPAHLEDRFSNHRSPLVSADGSLVGTREDWWRRRVALRAAWMEAMGPWPVRDWLPTWQVVARTNRLGVEHLRIRFEVARGQWNDAWLLIPRERLRGSAVVVAGLDPDWSVGLVPEKALHAHGITLALAGMVTLSLGPPGGDPERPDTGGAACQPLSYLACLADEGARLLATLPEVDRRRIGVVGHGYGGRWALFAAAFSDRFSVVAAGAPILDLADRDAGDLYRQPWTLGRPVAGGTASDPTGGTAFSRLHLAGHGYQDLVALIAPRPFFLIGGPDDPVDRWEVLNHGALVTELLGYPPRTAFRPVRYREPDGHGLGKVVEFLTWNLAGPHVPDGAVPDPAPPTRSDP